MKINIINKIKPHVNKNVWNYLKIKKLCVKYCEEICKDLLIFSSIDKFNVNALTISNSFIWEDSKYGYIFWKNINDDYKMYYELLKTIKII